MRLGVATARFVLLCFLCYYISQHFSTFSQNLKPEYERLAGILKGIVNVAAVDADQYKSLGGRFGIQGFPTIKLFNIDKQKPEDYQGERNSGAMLECDSQLFVHALLVPSCCMSSHPNIYACSYCKKAIKDVLAARVSGKVKPSSGSTAPPSPKKPHQQQFGGGKSSSGAPGTAVSLTAATFESDVLQSKNIWLVEASILQNLCSAISINEPFLCALTLVF
jgi:protein disulfide-isomerase A6